MSIRQSKNSIIPWDLVGYVVCIWLIGMLVLLFAQVFFGTNGLAIYPAGEDYTWLRLMQPDVHYGVQQSWWATHSRNPLAPWWYWSIRSLIFKFPESLYLARKVIELFLGISVLLMTYELFKRKHVWISLWIATLVLFWNFSYYIEQALFIMLISLVFSLFSVYTYLLYLNSGRTHYRFLITSMVLFFIALGTYSIQCAVPLAILVIGIANALEQPNSHERKNAIRQTLLDIVGYVAFLILFLQIWITTSGPTSSYFVLKLGLFVKNFFHSIKFFAWHTDINLMAHGIITDWNVGIILLITILCIASFTILSFFRKMRIEPIEYKSSERFIFLLPFAVLLALSVPTIILESTSDMWYPGSRSEMLQEVFNPVAYVCIFIFCAQWLRLYWKEKWIKAVVSGFFIVTCTSVYMLSLEYNRQLYVQTNFEHKLVATIKQLIPKDKQQSATILVKVKNFKWYDGRYSPISNQYIQYIYNNPNIGLETVGDTSSIRNGDPIIFGKKEKGVYIPNSKTWIPYSNLLVLEADKDNINVINEITPNTFPTKNVVFSDVEKVQLNEKQFL